MPVDLDLTPTPPNVGQAGNPVGLLGGVLGLQNQAAELQLKQNANQQFQQSFAAHQAFGQILAKHPGDMAGAVNEFASTPYAAWAPEIGQTMSETAGSLARLQNENMSMNQSAMKTGAQLLAAGINDYTKLPGAYKAALAVTTNPEQRKAITSLYQAATSGLDFNEKDPTKRAQYQQQFVSQGLGMMVGAGGLPLADVVGGSGNLPASESVAPGGASTINPSTIPSLARLGVTGQPGNAPPPAQSNSAPPPVAGDGKPLPAPDQMLPTGQMIIGRNNVAGFKNQADAESASHLRDEFNKAQPQYDMAANSVGRLTAVQDDLTKLAQTKGGADSLLYPGPAGQLRSQLAGVINTASKILNPDAPVPIDISKTMAAEDATKEAITSGFQIAHSFFGSGREPLGVVENALAAVPSLNNSPLGGMLVADVLKAGAQWQLDQRAFKQDWLSRSNGNLNGADPAFAQLHKPEDYIKPVMDKYGLTPKGFKDISSIDKLRQAGLITDKMAYDAALKQGFISQKTYDAGIARLQGQ